MWTRRNFLRMMPAPALLGRLPVPRRAPTSRGSTPTSTSTGTPRCWLTEIKASNWRGLDIVVCPAVGDEPFDLEEKLRAMLKVARESGGTLAWASTFDGLPFESPHFPACTIERLN